MDGGSHGMSGMVSIVIPVYNRKEEIIRCLRSIKDQEYRPIEIIVVDDGSSDGTAAVIRSMEDDDIRLLHSETRCGPSYARNIGIMAVKGEYVLFLDSDTVLENRQVVKAMVRKLEEDPRVGSVGGEIPVYLGLPGEVRGRQLNYFGESTPSSVRADIGKEPLWRECTYLATCNCMMRIADLKTIGGFDPYFVFGGEDTDVGYALGKIGRMNFVGSRTGVQHYHIKTGRYANETYRYHSTRVRFNLKHFGAARNSIILLWDILRIATFYILLPAKIAYLLASGRQIARENWLGGAYILKAYATNLLHYPEIRRARKRNFLDDMELARFVQLRREQNI